MPPTTATSMPPSSAVTSKRRPSTNPTAASSAPSKSTAPASTGCTPTSAPATSPSANSKLSLLSLGTSNVLRVAGLTPRPAPHTIRLQREVSMHTRFNPTRREFLGSVAAFSIFPLEIENPHLILYNPNTFTVDDTQPAAQAVSISHGRFLAVGSNDDVLHLATAATKKLDLAGKTVLPGFNHAHSPPTSSGLDRVVPADCDLPSIASIQPALRARAA